MTTITSSGSIVPGRTGQEVLERSRMVCAVAALVEECRYDASLVEKRARGRVGEFDFLLQELHRGLAFRDKQRQADSLARFDDVLSDLHLKFLCCEFKRVRDALEVENYSSGLRLLDSLERKKALFVDLLSSQQTAMGSVGGSCV